MLYLDFDYYKGPFDTLLELCSKNKIEINEINISEIIDVYLNFIKQDQQNFNLSAQYLVLSAHLIEIKTRILLKIELEEEQKLEITDFINSLLEYKKYQQYSLKLKQILHNKKIYVSKSKSQFEQVEEIYNPNFEQSQQKLIKVYEKILKKFKLENEKKQIKNVNLSEISLSDVKKDIQKQIIKKRNMKFSKIKFEDQIHLIVTFLALLELANNQIIILQEVEGDLNIHAIEKQNIS